MTTTSRFSHDRISSRGIIPPRRRPRRGAEARGPEKTAGKAPRRGARPGLAEPWRGSAAHPGDERAA